MGGDYRRGQEPCRGSRGVRVATQLLGRRNGARIYDEVQSDAADAADERAGPFAGLSFAWPVSPRCEVEALLLETATATTAACTGASDHSIAPLSFPSIIQTRLGAVSRPRPGT